MRKAQSARPNAVCISLTFVFTLSLLLLGSCEKSSEVKPDVKAAGESCKKAMTDYIEAQISPSQTIELKQFWIDDSRNKAKAMVYITGPSGPVNPAKIRAERTDIQWKVIYLGSDEAYDGGPY